MTSLMTLMCLTGIDLTPPSNEAILQDLKSYFACKNCSKELERCRMRLEDRRVEDALEKELSQAAMKADSLRQFQIILIK